MINLYFLLLTLNLQFILKANDSDTWRTHIICCTVISFASGMIGVDMPVHCSSLRKVAFYLNMPYVLKKDHIPFSFF
jgi:hypothetical protein